LPSYAFPAWHLVAGSRLPNFDLRLVIADLRSSIASLAHARKPSAGTE
jgi:hypothetical protein